LVFFGCGEVPDAATDQRKKLIEKNGIDHCRCLEIEDQIRETWRGGQGIIRDGWSVPLSWVVVELAAATTHESG